MGHLIKGGGEKSCQDMSLASPKKKNQKVQQNAAPYFNGVYKEYNC